jgi:alanine racemase
LKSTVTAPREASGSNSPANTHASAISSRGNTTTTRKARLTVDLGALAANYAYLGTRAPGAEVAGVVKADAYGLGAGPVAKALFESGCRSFFVATPEEGAALRKALPVATRSLIYVLHGFAGATPRDLAEEALIPVLSTAEDVALLAAYAKAEGQSMPAALHVDTGMNRLGLPLAGLADLGLDGLSLVLVMSHLASADEPGNPSNAEQRARFETVKARFPGVRASLANSAGILLGSAYHADLVRPGIALYGGNPLPDQPNPLYPVACLEAPLLQIRDAAPGERVGYGGTYTVERPSRLATLGIGYADGYLRSLGNRGRVLLGGQSAPIVGRISMDLTVIDVTQIPEEATRPGALAELFGPGLPLDEVAATAGTINYELLTRLGQRLARSYPAPRES